MTMLFDGYPDPPPTPDRTPVQRRRDRQLAAIKTGVHPLNGLPLLDSPAGQTCGTCAHRRHYRMAAKPYPKCELGPLAHGPATDVRASWPACTQWEASA